MKIVIHPKYQIFSKFISKIPAIFHIGGETIYSGRNVVKRFNDNQTEYIVKRYKTPNLIQQIVYTFFKKSKAERAYLYAALLLAKNINTPTGIAFIEQKRRGLINDCYFISSSCTHPAVYPELVTPAEYNRQLAQNLAKFFVQLHTNGVLHGDPNLNNILYTITDDGEYQFTVIDTNRSVFKSSPTPQECLDNLKRVTHRRDLLQYIVEQYAILRQWDVACSTSKTLKALDKFEKQKKIRRIIKKRVL